MLSSKKKEKVIKDFQLHKGDTGSSEYDFATVYYLKVGDRKSVV